MKHHIIAKFLAVFLCAASLLGAVGSGLGMFAMTELGLRDRTLEEAYADSMQNTAENLANELAVRYAAKELGGADESLLNQYYSNYWLYNAFDWNQVGYTIRDEEGNVLGSITYNDAAGTPARYEFNAGGSRYLKVQSTMKEEEYHALNNPVTMPPNTVPAEDSYAYFQVPAYGREIGKILVFYVDGSTGEYGIGSESIGSLTWDAADQLKLELHNFNDSPPAQNLISDFRNGWAVVNITMIDTQGNVVLDAGDPHGLVQEFSGSSGIAYVLFCPMEDTPLEMGSYYDAIPPEGQNVASCTVEYADGYSESVGGAPDIGFLGYDEDHFLVFTANEPGLMEFRDERVVYITFGDSEGYMVFQARDAEGVGRFVLENDTLIFTNRESTGMESTPAEPGTGVYIYDDVPPRGYAVYEMDLWLEGSSEMLTITGTDDCLGMATHDDNGNVIFTAEDWKDFVFSKPAQVRYILMSGQDGRVLYEAYEEGASIGSGSPIGYFAYDETGDLVFSRITDLVAFASMTEASETAPAELPVEVETVPETTEETLLTDESAALEAAETVAVNETIEATEPAVSEETVESTEPAYALDTANETLPEAVPTTPPQDYLIFGYYDDSDGEHMIVEYTYEEMPPYTVEILLGPGAMQNQYEWLLMELVYRFANLLIPVLIASLVLFAITAVYLCCAAGRKPGSTEIRAGGLNCLPLDLYLAAAAGGVVLCAYAVVEGGDYLLRRDVQTGVVFAALCAYAACLLIIGFCFAFVAQAKTPGGYFWRNSVCGRSLKIIVWLWNKFVDLCGWLWSVCRRKLAPALLRLGKAGWKLVKFFCLQLKKGTIWLCRKLIQGCNWLSRVLGRFLAMLPLTWQFLLIGFSLVFFLYIMIRTYKVGYLLLGFGIFFGVILYAASAFGILLESAKRMRKGDLDSKVDDKLLIGSFREFADELNGLADVAVVAAQQQLKSERMKTELITNVSHDIKTPLTSIINYVDLMEKPHSHEEQQAYLEVLSRQSQRLKKLIDDLMEMSKASTGNMAVDITRVNAGEAVNQALGEFADKLEKAQLIPVFRQPDKEICMMADGRLVWRVLSNVLSNAVKYALPGTRVYIDLMELEGKVVLSLKNISREPLNVSADELLERFVRGDTARNTEGSGLGLNIAQSLMELQKGKLELLVDGDLFKVTLIFPGA